MTRYTITASVTVDVEMSIEAESELVAQEVFDSQLAMSATLTELPADSFDVSEDSISNIDSVKIRAEAANG